MIIPIGHEQSVVRRLPYVTFGIIGLCVLVNLLLPSEALLELAEPWAIEDVADYWRDHAYLEADPRVRDEVALDVASGDREAYLAELRNTSIEWAPDSIDERMDEQDALDRMTRAALGETSDNPYMKWGLVPDDPGLLSLVTHIFLHAGWIHLLGNMFLLFIAAPAVEDRWGRPLFGGFFLLAGLLAAGFYSLLTPDRAVPLVGASGAIAGVLGAFLVLYAKVQIRFAYFFFLGFRPYRGTFQAPAWMMLPLWFGNELLQAGLAHSMGFSDGIAYWAHVGGFVAGAGMAFGIVRSGVEERYLHAAIESKVTFSSIHPDAERAFELREEGKLDEAIALLEGARADKPDDTDLCLGYWDAMVAAGRAPEAADAARTLIRERAREKELSQAAQYWLELVDNAPDELLDPDSLLRIAPALLALDNHPRTVLALRQALDPRQSRLTAGTALRIAEQAREIDAPTALRALERALELGDFPDAKRERLVEQARELREGKAAEAEQAAQEAAARPAWQTSEAIEIEPEEDLSRPPGYSDERDEPRVAPSGFELAEDGGLAALELPPDLADSPQEPPPLPVAVPAPPPAAASPPPVPASPPPVPASPPPVPGTSASGAPALDLAPPPIPGEAAPDMLDANALDPAAFEEAVPGGGDDAGDPLFAALASGDDSYELGDPNSDQAVTPTAAPLLSTPPPVPEPAAEEKPPPALEQRGDDWWELDDGSTTTQDGPDDDGEAVSAALGDDSFAELVDSLAELPRFSDAKIIDARPTSLTDDTVRMRLTDGRKTKLEYAKLQGVAVAAVAGLADQPVVLIDLLLNWSETDAELLRVIRLRSDRFDPRSLAPDTDDPTAALRHFLAALLDASGATPVPDRSAAVGEPFGRYPDLASYERDVLKLDR